MQAVTKNPHDAQVVAKVLRRNSSLTGLGKRQSFHLSKQASIVT